MLTITTRIAGYLYRQVHDGSSADDVLRLSDALITSRRHTFPTSNSAYAPGGARKFIFRVPSRVVALCPLYLCKGVQLPNWAVRTGGALFASIRTWPTEVLRIPALEGAAP